jgi:hypothetical protein
MDTVIALLGPSPSFDSLKIKADRITLTAELAVSRSPDLEVVMLYVARPPVSYGAETAEPE